VSLTVSDLAETFGRTKTDITWGITLVLMFRSVGSIVFGIAADRYGRKWPFIVNNVLFIILELVSLCFPQSSNDDVLRVPVATSFLDRAAKPIPLRLGGSAEGAGNIPSTACGPWHHSSHPHSIGRLGRPVG
jgi:MFS family permease